MEFLTEFIGDDEAAKVNVFVTPQTINDSDDINDDYALSELCDTFPFCSGWSGMEEFTNPYCNRPDNLIALWDNNCSDLSESVANHDFSSDISWVLPTKLQNLSIELPTELD